jgi:N-acylglucosamine-6-phosphate 2-epimerase
VPVIGIRKVYYDGDRARITPTLDHAEELVDAGADLVAMEATFESQPDDQRLFKLVRGIREELSVPVMADVSTFDEGKRAWEAGAELVATTIAGHTSKTRQRPLPDLSLVEELAHAGVRVVCEGSVRTPEETAKAFDAGAWAVVIGTAITDPLIITSWFAKSADEHLEGSGVAGRNVGG